MEVIMEFMCGVITFQREDYFKIKSRRDNIGDSISIL